MQLVFVHCCLVCIAARNTVSLIFSQGKLVALFFRVFFFLTSKLIACDKNIRRQRQCDTGVKEPQNSRVHTTIILQYALGKGRISKITNV